jgi:hypothetical protein
MIALIDIDGVLADCGHRLHFINGPDRGVEPNWAAFFDAMDRDTPIKPAISLVNSLCESYNVVYLTGRPDSHREMTLEWLRKYKLPAGVLTMRKAGDYRPDYVVKRELYEATIKPLLGEANLVIEDRKQVVDMWRELGVFCLQPKDGDY